MNSNAIILFARDPLAGQVKTRLQSVLDPETVLQLYTRFLDDSLELISRIDGADAFCGVYPSTVSGYFDDAASRFGVSVFLQTGEDLGGRMRHALQEKFAAGYRNVAIIGSDSPSLPAPLIEKALESEKDLFIGPSTDRGYYLVGMREKVVDIFSGVSWGSESVLAETLDRVRQAGARLELLPPWYDVDRPEDLRFLKIHLELLEQCGNIRASATWDFIRTLEF